jgi:hypothetical protein
MSTMLQLLKTPMHTSASGSQKSIIWDQETLSVNTVMLSIGRQRKTVTVCLLSAV